MAPCLYTPEEDAFILKHVNDLSFRQLAEAMTKKFKADYSRHQIRGRYLWLEKMDQSEKQIRQTIANRKKGTEVIGVVASGGQLKTYTFETDTIRTQEEFAAEANIDLKAWEITHFEVTKWDGFAKIRSYKHAKDDWRRELGSVQLFRVKLSCKPRLTNHAGISVLRAQLIEDMNKASPRHFKKIERPSRLERRTMAVVSVADHHFGKLAWAEETGGRNYDLKIAAEDYASAVQDLISQIRAYPLDKIVFPIGNDLMHVDGKDNATTNGTQQDVDGRWQKAFLITKRCVCEAIEALREIAPVQVTVIPGNHDFQRTFYLGDTISSYFRLDPEVHVDNAPTNVKFLRYGANLLGFAHGDCMSEQELPMIMAETRAEDYAETIHREWLTGHRHTRQLNKYVPKKFETMHALRVLRGVHVRITPSLCPPDAWHARSGYVYGPQASEVYLYDHNKGYVGQFVHNHPGDRE